MLLFFLRHGEAGFNAPSDSERELTPEGETAAKNIGLYCKKSEIYFSHAFASPLKRAQQTAKIVLSQFHGPTLETLEHLTPESDPRNLLAELKFFPDSSSILLVSHEPFCSTTISLLVSTDSNAAVIMKPTTLACVEVMLPVGRGMGKLQWLIPEKIARQFI